MYHVGINDTWLGSSMTDMRSFPSFIMLVKKFSSRVWVACCLGTLYTHEKHLWEVHISLDSLLFTWCRRVNDKLYMWSKFAFFFWSIKWWKMIKLLNCEDFWEKPSFVAFPFKMTFFNVGETLIVSSLLKYAMWRKIKIPTIMKIDCILITYFHCWPKI